MLAPPAFGAEFRSEFLLAPGIAHLNHGSFGAVLRCVEREQQRWRQRMEANPTAFFVREVPAATEAVRHRLARSLGAAGEDLALVENATAGANAVLRSMALQPGDEIVCTSQVYGAVRRTIDAVCRRSGARAVEVPLPFPAVDPDALGPLLDAAISERTRLLVVDHVTSATALVLPVAAAVAVGRRRGVPVLIDGAHAPGMVELRLDELGADFYVGNLHKWICAARGTAFLWARAGGDRSWLQPTVTSHRCDEPFPSPFDWVGTRDPTAWLSLPAALDFWDAVGPERVREHNRALCLRGRDRLLAAIGASAPAPDSMIGSIATVPCPLPGEPTQAGAEDLMLRLRREHGLHPMPVPFEGRLWVRISAHVYNEPAEYDRLAAVFAGAA
jgi:isopenicillin-N epimerase